MGRPMDRPEVVAKRKGGGGVRCKWYPREDGGGNRGKEGDPRAENEGGKGPSSIREGVGREG